MARIKQTAHKSTEGAPPHLHLVAKAAQVAAQKAIAVRKPHRWCPGTVAQREIRKFKKNRSPHQENPLPASYTRDPRTSIQKE
jgi:histone H3